MRPCHTAAILSRETKKALFYHAKPHLHGLHCEAWRGKSKLFWSPGTIWPPCDKDELVSYFTRNCVVFGRDGKLLFGVGATIQR